MVDQISSGRDPIASAMAQAGQNMSMSVGVAVMKKTMSTESAVLNELMKGLGVGNNLDSRA